jgi:mRNA interferase MazF
MAKVQRRPSGKEQKISAILRGEIYLCTFDPTVGHEIRKTRPALIIQNDFGNQFSPLTIVAAITSKVSPAPRPFEVVIEPTPANGLDVRSSVRLNQIRSVDRRRLIRRLGVVEPAIMANVDEALKISLGLVRI